MYSYEDLYQLVENPLTDQVILKCVLAYARGADMYSYVINGNIADKKIDSHPSKKDRDLLYTTLYEEWKNNILNLNEEQIETLIANHVYDEDIKQLIDILQQTSSIKGKNKYESLCSKYLVFKKYRFVLNGKENWKHINSFLITGKISDYFPIEYRLYINPDVVDIDHVALMFISKCQKWGIPFYLKYQETASRDDCFVIYSSKENVTKYISIIKEMEMENPSLFARFHGAPILTGKIDKYIGLAGEPVKDEFGESVSYNESRANIIKKAIREESSKWIYENQDKNVTYQKQSIPLRKYIVNKIAEKTVEKYTQMIDACHTTKEKEAFFDKCGINKDDIMGNALYLLAEYYVQENIDEIISNYYHNKAIKTITFLARDKKHLIVENTTIISVLKSLSNAIIKNDVSFTGKLKNRINELCLDNNIDPKSICFNNQKERTLEKKEKMINADIQTYHIANIWKLFNPSVLEKYILGPNNELITVKKYIEDYVFPFIPQDGFFTLKDGSRIPFYEYIENYVLFEGQNEKYPHFMDLLVDTTRLNRGFIMANNDIYPADSISFMLDSKLMKKKVHLSDGTIITAKEYVDHYLSSFIPESGIVLLKSGAEISIKEYIENVIFNENHLLYYGDITRIIESTMLGNTGTIVLDWEKETLKTIEDESLMNQRHL